VVLKVLNFFLALSLVFASPVGNFSKFQDLPQEHWAYEVIENLTSLGIIAGYPDKTFHPEGSVTRAEFAKIITLSFKIPVPSNSGSRFPDVGAFHWGAPFVEACALEGIIEGYPDGNFYPEKPVSKEEVLTILIRRILPDQELLPESVTFPDVEPERWSSPYIEAALTLGLFTRDDPLFTEKGLFHPDVSCTRTQACYLVFRARFLGASLYLGAPSTYEVNYTVHLVNRGAGRSGELDFTLALFPDVLPFQKVESLALTPLPEDYEEDDHGNQYALFRLDGINPGESVSLSMVAEVEVFPFTYFPDPEINNLTYLKSTPGYECYTSSEPYEESGSPEIQEKSEEFPSGNSHFDAALEVYDFVRSYLEYSGYNPQSSGALEALFSGKGDCTEFADLFVALARAKGIPSRFVEGFTYNPGSQGRGDLTHDWAEIMLPGEIWLPVDPTYGRFGENYFCSSDNKHIILTRGRNLDLLGGYHYYYYTYSTGGGLAEINSWDEISIIPLE